jgi:Domain of unknown function (DUF4234)
MTDTPDARARATDGADGDTPPAPAAHTHPPRPPAPTAVMEPKPPQMPPAFGWPKPAPQGSEPSPGAAPPPFGFNAPRPEEDEATLPGAPATSPGRAGTAAPPPAARPFAMPVRPQTSTLASPTAQPRELMPAVPPVEQRRLGEIVTPTFGPPGRHRSPLAMAVLSVLTLGVYAIAWHRRANQEMGDFDPRIHVHPGRSAWAVFLPWFAGLLASAAATGIVLAFHFGVPLDVHVTAHQALPAVGALGAVPYLVLFIPFSLVAVVRTAERVRLVEEHAGVTTDAQIRPASVVGWLLVPVIGGLVLMGRQQGHLNHIWDLARE